MFMLFIKSVMEENDPYFKTDVRKIVKKLAINN